MPFIVLYALQFILLLILYTAVTVGLPALALRKRLEDHTLSESFLICLITGNFFISGLVTLLELLHICNFITLLLSSLALFAACSLKLNGTGTLRRVGHGVTLLTRAMSGSMGLNTFLLRSFRAFKKRMRARFASFGAFALRRLPDLILTASAMTLILWRFGLRASEYYGFAASDMVTHNLWLNAMSDNNIYAGGVYPFGMHATLFFFRCLFGIDNNVLLRAFAPVQTLMLMLVIIAVLKGCCRNKFLPYTAVFGFTAATFGLAAEDAYYRLFAALPQEYGLMFVLPSVYFVWRYFRIRRLELAGIGGRGGMTSPPYLALFAASFSMTISAHFYNTFVVGFFVIGGAIAYLPRLIKKEYLLGLLIAGSAGLIIGAAPMAAAYITGTPPEGSLKWGIGVIQGTVKPEVSSPADELTYEDFAPSEADAPVSDKLMARAEFALELLARLFYDNKLAAAIALVPAPAMVIFGLLLVAEHDGDRGARLITTGLCLILLLLTITSDATGFPSIMSRSRADSFFAYIMPAGIAMLIDVFLSESDKWLASRNVLAIAPSAVLAAVSVIGLIFGQPMYPNAYQTNGAVICLANIISENADRSWTICSANDERVLADTHGHHYELIDLLAENEKGGELTFPTRTVYFFVEKVPIDYYEIPYENSGQRVSEDCAAQKLPDSRSFSCYRLENRRIVMSKAYYWTQAFAEMYPNEMKVYYESDDFICWRLEQNINSLFDLNIGFGNNN